MKVRWDELPGAVREALSGRDEAPGATAIVDDGPVRWYFRRTALGWNNVGRGDAPGFGDLVDPPRPTSSLPGLPTKAKPVVEPRAKVMPLRELAEEHPSEFGIDSSTWKNGVEVVRNGMSVLDLEDLSRRQGIGYHLNMGPRGVTIDCDGPLAIDGNKYLGGHFVLKARGGLEHGEEMHLLYQNPDKMSYSAVYKVAWDALFSDSEKQLWQQHT